MAPGSGGSAGGAPGSAGRRHGAGFGCGLGRAAGFGCGAGFSFRWGGARFGRRGAPGSATTARVAQVRAPAAAEILVPFVAAIVPEVDLQAGRLIIDPPPGLLDQVTCDQDAPDQDRPDQDTTA